MSLCLALASQVVSVGGGGPVSCAYPLDDDGSLAGALGYIYAGPATGDDQQTMDYTAAVPTAAALLMPAAALTTARFSRPSSGYAVAEGLVSICTGTAGGNLILAITDAGGTILNVANIIGGNGNTGLLAVTLDSAGAVAAYANEAPHSVTWSYADPAPTTVGATDKATLLLGCTDNAAVNDRVVMTLRTQAADITGSYGAGGKDFCGNAL